VFRKKKRKIIYLGQHNKMEDNNKRKNNTETVVLKPNPAQHFAGLRSFCMLFEYKPSA
jgi:hypothetical protein